MLQGVKIFLKVFQCQPTDERGAHKSNEKGAMPMTTFLLLIILILLVAVIVLMFTIWPARQRAEIEKAVSGLRREMAEHQGNSVRLIQTIRNDVEDAVQESLEREMADFMRSGAGSQTSFQRPATTSVATCLSEGGRMSQREGDTATQDKESVAQQLSLFQQQVDAARPALSESPVKLKEQVADKKQVSAEPMEEVQAVLHDDIPDMGDLPDIDDLD